MLQAQLVLQERLERQVLLEMRGQQEPPAVVLPVEQELPALLEAQVLLAQPVRPELTVRLVLLVLLEPQVLLVLLVQAPRVLQEQPVQQVPLVQQVQGPREQLDQLAPRVRLVQEPQAPLVQLVQEPPEPQEQPV